MSSVKFTLELTEDQFTHLNKYAEFSHYLYNHLVTCVKQIKHPNLTPSQLTKMLRDEAGRLKSVSHTLPWWTAVPSRLIESTIQQIYSLRQHHITCQRRRLAGEEDVPPSYDLMLKPPLGEYIPVVSLPLSPPEAGYFCKLVEPITGTVTHWLRLPEPAHGKKLGWLQVSCGDFNFPVPRSVIITFHLYERHTIECVYSSEQELVLDYQCRYEVIQQVPY